MVEVLVLSLQVLVLVDMIVQSSQGRVNDRLSLSRFQKASNGFDIRGIVSRPGTELTYNDKYGPQLCKEDVFWFGFGFSKWLMSKSAAVGNIPLSVGIGYDCRSSGPFLASWFAGGVDAAGMRSYDVGMCTTPSMFLSCSMDSVSTSSNLNRVDINLPFDGAISITASHLPSMWNGIKFFDSSSPSNIGEEGIRGVIEAASDPSYDHITEYEMQRSSWPLAEPFLPVYSEFLKNTVRRMLPDTDLPLSNLRICVNAGNGAGGFLAKTLAELGADTSMSIHLDPDGSFPNHIANPEDTAAITATANAVLQSHADLGICLDTDADRTGLVDASGRLLNRNALIALVSRISLRNSIGGTIVTDSATSKGLTDFIEGTLGGKHIRYKKGYRFVIELGRATPGCVAAVECSGHGAWRDNGWVDDGCYTSVRLVAELARMRQPSSTPSSVSLVDLLEDFREPEDSVELRLHARRRGEGEGEGEGEGRGQVDMEQLTTDAISVLLAVTVATDGWLVEPVNHEGLRVQFRMDCGRWEGWCMLRASLHEPILSLQIESEQAGGAARAARILLHGSGTCSGLLAIDDKFDLAPLLEFAGSVD